jgi:hypothetical protein
LGLPPSASDQQFIPSDVVLEASKRNPIFLNEDALVAGVDVSRGGEDNTVIYFRRGFDALTYQPVTLSAQITRDSQRVIQAVADLFSRDFGNGLKLAHIFMDETGLGGPMVDWLKALGHTRVTGVNFGSMAPKQGYLNMRAYMWDQLKSWLKNGAIGKDSELKDELISPGYSYNMKSQLVLESKESMKRRGVRSPNNADALALTFAATVGVRRPGTPQQAKHQMIRNLRDGCNTAWMS